MAPILDPVPAVSRLSAPVARCVIDARVDFLPFVGWRVHLAFRASAVLWPAIPFASVAIVGNGHVITNSNLKAVPASARSVSALGIRADILPVLFVRVESHPRTEAL